MIKKIQQFKTNPLGTKRTIQEEPKKELGIYLFLLYPFFPFVY